MIGALQASEPADSAWTQLCTKLEDEIFQWQVSLGHVQLEQRSWGKTQEIMPKSKSEKDT